MPASASTRRPANSVSGRLFGAVKPHRPGDPQLEFEPRETAFRALDQHLVHFLKACAGLAQRTRRQQTAVAQATVAVDDANLKVPRHSIMLQSVIRQYDFRASATARRAAPARSTQTHTGHSACVASITGSSPTSPGSDCGVTITGVRCLRPPYPRLTIAGLRPRLRQGPREPAGDRRLAGSAHADITDDDHRRARGKRTQPAVSVGRSPQGDSGGKQTGRRTKQGAEPATAAPTPQVPCQGSIPAVAKLQPVQGGVLAVPGQQFGGAGRLPQYARVPGPRCGRRVPRY